MGMLFMKRGMRTLIYWIRLKSLVVKVLKSSPSFHLLYRYAFSFEEPSFMFVQTPYQCVEVDLEREMG